MKHALALILACCALVALTACSSGYSGPPPKTMAEEQIDEARIALSSGQITMAEFLNLKQKAEQAEAQRSAILFAAP